MPTAPTAPANGTRTTTRTTTSMQVAYDGFYKARHGWDAEVHAKWIAQLRAFDEAQRADDEGKR